MIQVMISTCEKYTTPSKVKILELIDHHHPAVSVVTQVTTALHCGILYYNIPTEIAWTWCSVQQNSPAAL